MNWIDKSERLPGPEDLDPWRCVLVWHVYSGPMITGADNLRRNRYMTHWMRCPAGPGADKGGKGEKGR